MIAKHIPMRSLGKSDFAELVNYLTDDQAKLERVGNIKVSNCDAETLKAVIAEVLATQHSNTRSKSDKTFHLVVSFRAGENPDEETLNAIEERIVESLGYSEHQRVSVLHTDTDNLHFHLAINKIHPKKLTQHDPFQSYRTLGEICSVLETEFNLEQDNHVAEISLSEGRANDMERHSGIESLVTWMRRECLPEMQQANDWKSFHEAIEKHGLSVKQKGNGLVFETADGLQVKASSIDRNFSKPKLEERLGAFLPSKNAPQKNGAAKYDKRPLASGIDTSKLFEQYLSEQEGFSSDRKKAFDRARQSKARKIAARKRANKLRRSAIKLMGESPLNKKLLYNQAYKSLQADLKAIHAEYKREYAKLNKRYERQAWADWLQQKSLEGNVEALDALRARGASKEAKTGNHIRGKEQGNPLEVVDLDNITKEGTIIYKTGIRDDGEKLKLSHDLSLGGVTEALKIAVDKYGKRLEINGSAEFKAHVILAAAQLDKSITFTDAALDKKRADYIQQKENNHERRRKRSEQFRRRADSRGIGDAGRGIADRNGRNAGSAGRSGAGNGVFNRSNEHIAKPGISKLGRKPPPQSQNRLRGLSELGVVRIANRSQVLLPRNVSGDLEHKGKERADTLRRDSIRAGITTETLASAKAYVAEREEKRNKGFDISAHRVYDSERGTAIYQGLRKINNNSLTLLKIDNEILVCPVNEKTARTLKRARIGDTVTITDTNIVRKSGVRRR